MAHVFITGSADGLGRATAETLLGDGHEVIVHARSAERLTAVNDLIGGGASAVVGDLADLDQTRALADQVNDLGRVDAVIHNAGVYSGRQVMPVNVVAPYLLTELSRQLAGRIGPLHRRAADLRRISAVCADIPDSGSQVDHPSEQAIGYTSSRASEVDRSPKAFACSCRSFAFCSAMPMASAPAIKRRGGCSWLSIVMRARELGGVAYLLTVHTLVPLHPLCMTIGVVRNRGRGVVGGLLRRRSVRKNPGLTMVVVMPNGSTSG